MTIVNFRAGENPLNGVSPNHTNYHVNYWGTAIPTVENIDSILTWQAADSLRIYGPGNVTLELLERIDNFSGLTKLRFLDLPIDSTTYKNVKPAKFIENLPALTSLRFIGRNMNDVQLKEFRDQNPAPAKWSGYQSPNSVEYLKSEI